MWDIAGIGGIIRDTAVFECWDQEQFDKNFENRKTYVIL